jgi:hypothetical protein
LTLTFIVRLIVEVIEPFKGYLLDPALGSDGMFVQSSRIDYLEEFQRLIDAYNARSANTETYFDQLVDLARRLDEEDQRHVRTGLSEEELAVFDILTRPEVSMWWRDRARSAPQCPQSGARVGSPDPTLGRAVQGSRGSGDPL